MSSVENDPQRHTYTYIVYTHRMMYIPTTNGVCACVSRPARAHKRCVPRGNDASRGVPPHLSAPVPSCFLVLQVTTVSLPLPAYILRSCTPQWTDEADCPPGVCVCVTSGCHLMDRWTMPPITPDLEGGGHRGGMVYGGRGRSAPLLQAHSGWLTGNLSRGAGISFLDQTETASRLVWPPVWFNPRGRLVAQVSPPQTPRYQSPALKLPHPLPQREKERQHKQ